jgi:hypothetical protein
MEIKPNPSTTSATVKNGSTLRFVWLGICETLYGMGFTLICAVAIILGYAFAGKLNVGNFITVIQIFSVCGTIEIFLTNGRFESVVTLIAQQLGVRNSAKSSHKKSNE